MTTHTHTRSLQSPRRRLVVKYSSLVFSTCLVLAVSLVLFASKPNNKNTPANAKPESNKAQVADKKLLSALQDAVNYSVVPSQKKSGEWIANNLEHNWSTSFDGRGFLTTPKKSKKDSANWQWGLQLKSYGFSGSEVAVNKPASVKAEAARVSYKHSDELEEWFSNEVRGLEHGFTVNKRLGNPAPGTLLTFSLAVLGNLDPRASRDGQTVAFADVEGTVALNYGGLKVWDAEGKILSARMESKAAEVLIHVDEQNARYPLTVDPLAGGSQTYIKAPLHTVADEFGHAVSIDGNIMVVGAPLVDTAGIDAGAAYVYENVGGVWTYRAALLPTRSLAGAPRFGGAVKVSGDTIVVGAWGDDESTTGVNPSAQAVPLGVNNGAAYVFVRTGPTTWTQQAYLKGHNTSGADAFGQGVAISGDTLVVTAPWNDDSAQGIQNGAAAAGDILQTDSGAAYVFTRTAGVWTQQSYLKASNAEAFDYFGGSPFVLDVDFTGAVDISGDTIVIGAPWEDSVSTGVNGAQGNYDFLGGSSSPRNVNFGAQVGAAYTFQRAGANWTQSAYLKPSNTDTLLLTGDNFGSSVAIDGDNIVVGSPLEDGSGTGVNPADNNLAADSGAAYTFTRAGATWAPGAYLKAIDGAVTAERFGWSVDISGTKGIVGAPWESSNGTGVNPPGNNIASNTSGAAYTYTGGGMVWAPENYYKACNNDPVDIYGHAVAISNDCPVVGAPYEDGSGVLINPADDNANVNAGAVYIPGACNTPPTITGTPVSVVQSSTATAVPVATASDLEDPKNNLIIEISSDGGLMYSPATATLNGVTVTLVDQNGVLAGTNPTAAGAVIANVTTTCAAVNAAFTMRVTDTGSLTGTTVTTTPLNVTVTPNTAPALSYANVSANLTGAATNTPTVATDNIAITGFSIQSQGTYTGGVSVSPTGVVSFTNAGPVGTHFITVRATDGCKTTDAIFTITVKKMEVTVSDPVVSSNPSTPSVHAELTNTNSTPAAFSYTAPFPAPVTGIPGTCVTNFGTCAITPTGITVTGTLPPGQTLMVDYKIMIPAGTPPGTISITSMGKLDVNMDGNFDTVNTVTANLVLQAPAKVNNIGVSDQKAGSVLVFPYYTSKAATSADTRLTISNLGTQRALVHLFFLDGATCQQADYSVCLTPNGSFSFKASDIDPEATGWLLAVAVDEQGRPIQNNALVGNAFVKDGAYVGNYGAEAFWANSPVLGTIDAGKNMTATLFFDGGSYDAMPNQFTVEVQSPRDVVGQKVVTVGMQGDLTQSQLTGAGQVGTGTAYNSNENPFGSFLKFLTGNCQAIATITTTNPRVPLTMGGLVPSGQAGTLNFNIGGGVGLIMTPQSAPWSGIRTLHKTSVTSTKLTIPLTPPIC